MTGRAKSVRDAALRLPSRARAALAAELIESLDEGRDPADEVEAAWAAEIERRVAEIDSGKAKLIPWPEVRRRIAATVKRAHRRPVGPVASSQTRKARRRPGNRGGAH